MAPAGKEMQQFTHILITSQKLDKMLKHYLGTHEILAKISGFKKIDFRLSHFPLVGIVLEQRSVILKRTIK